MMLGVALGALAVFTLLQIFTPWWLVGAHFVDRSALFYSVPLCPATPSQQSSQLTMRTLRTGAGCDHDDEASRRGGNGGGGSGTAIGVDSPMGVGVNSVDIMLRLADGFEVDESYLPVFIMGHGYSAVFTLTAVDATRKLIHREVTVQIGPNERFYPWNELHGNGDRKHREKIFEDLVEDLGEDLLEDLRERVSDLLEEVQEDSFDSLEDLLDGQEETEEEAAREREEEAREAAEEARERQEEEAEEEEEAELEEAEEAGLLVGAYIRQQYFTVSKRFYDRLELRRGGYYLPGRMSPDLIVPGHTLVEGSNERPSPPYFYGSGAVPKGAQLLVATEEYFHLRPGWSPSCVLGHQRMGRLVGGGACYNVSLLEQQVDADRYELAPAVALEGPANEWQWPLALRLSSLRLFSNGSADSETPFLVTFQPAGWEPQTALDTEGQQAHRNSPVMLGLLVMVAVGGAAASIFCSAQCHRCCPEIYSARSKVRPPGSRSPMVPSQWAAAPTAACAYGGSGSQQSLRVSRWQDAPTPLL